MSDRLFRSETFPVENSDKLACIVAGYRGKISSYRSVVRVLNGRGFNVVAYEHSPSVLTDGNPQELINLVDGICEDFSRKSKSYKKIVCLGTSLGSGIGFAIQGRVPNVQYGVYAAAGISPPENVFEASLFYFVRKNFLKKGVSPEKLKTLWAEVDILPDKPPMSNPFLMVLGKQDMIISYKKAFTTLRSWQTKGVPIKIISKTSFGHAGTIMWYKRHIGKLLNEAELLEA